MAPGALAVCGHQSSERMSVSSPFQVLPCRFRDYTVVFGCVPRFGQLGRAFQCRVAPLAGATPWTSGSTVSPVFLHLVCAISSVVVCPLLSFFLIIFLKAPPLCRQPVPLPLRSFPWGTGRAGKRLVAKGAGGATGGGSHASPALPPPRGRPGRRTGFAVFPPEEGLVLSFL